MERGLLFITNSDEWASSSFPDATTWINGSDVLEEFERVMEVRGALVARFDEGATEPGEAMWRLGERFVPVYLHRRCQPVAVVEAVGGMGFRYGVRGDPLPVTEVIDGDRQRRALDPLLQGLEPERTARIAAEIHRFLDRRYEGGEGTESLRGLARSESPSLGRLQSCRRRPMDERDAGEQS